MLMNEMSNRKNTKRGGLSVVARLMGMDTLPPETIPTTHLKESYDERLRQSISRITRCESTKGASIQLPSTTFNQTEDKLPLNWKKLHSKPTKSPISATPFGREHPQEEQLQKFKKEFKAWQDCKLWEFSSHRVQNNSIEGLKKEQILALANLNKEKIAGYTNTYTSVNKLKFTPNQFHGFQHDNNFSKHLMPQAKNEMPIRRELAGKSFEPASTAKFHEKISTPCSPSRIVILKSFSDNDELEWPRGGSPEVLEKGGSIEAFLEEVKERLRFELEGKGRNDSFSRLSSAHSSLQECSTYPKQLTRLVGKHIKENEATMGRSESTSSTEFHFDGQEFHKSMRERRKFITDRWENLLKNDSELEKAMLDDGRSVKFPSTKEKVIPKHFSHELVKRELVDNETMSHPKLIRSFSAPASRSTVTQNFQQHEALKNISAVVNKSKKYGFNIKGKVSNLRRTFSLKGNFFGKKASWIWDSTVDALSYMEPNKTMPLVVGNFGVVQDNPTEVPPSPASFLCSPMSVHHSPVSPLEVPFVEDNSSTQVSGELSMTLPGMRFGNMYCDPMMATSSHKIGARQRWTPTPIQLQILENIFEQGNGTPTKQKIKDVTLELTKHGQISETNVYNWFQNRRARSKRKHTSSAPSNAESETEIEIESPNDKKAKAEAAISQEGPLSSRVIDPSFQYKEKNSEVDSLNPDANRLLDYNRTNNLVGKMYYTGMDQLMGKMDSNWEL